MWRVFDAEAAVARAVLLRHCVEEVEQLGVGLIADGVDGDSYEDMFTWADSLFADSFI